MYDAGALADGDALVGLQLFEPRFVTAIFTGGETGDEGNILKCTVMFVEKEEIRPGIVGDGNVRPAIVVEVGENDAHALGFWLADARLFAEVGECAIVIVVVELSLLPFVVPGIAIGTIAGTAFTAP